MGDDPHRFCHCEHFHLRSYYSTANRAWFEFHHYYAAIFAGNASARNVQAIICGLHFLVSLSGCSFLQDNQYGLCNAYKGYHDWYQLKRRASPWPNWYAVYANLYTKRGWSKDQWHCLCASMRATCWFYTVPYFCSSSAVAWTWAAYCKFQRMSSNDGRLPSKDMHFFAMEMTIDNDSRELVVRINGSTIRCQPSWLFNNAISFSRNASLLLSIEGPMKDSSMMNPKL